MIWHNKTIIRRSSRIIWNFHSLFLELSPDVTRDFSCSFGVFQAAKRGVKEGLCAVEGVKCAVAKPIKMNACFGVNEGAAKRTRAKKGEWRENGRIVI